MFLRRVHTVRSVSSFTQYDKLGIEEVIMFTSLSQAMALHRESDGVKLLEDVNTPSQIMQSSL